MNELHSCYELLNIPLAKVSTRTSLHSLRGAVMDGMGDAIRRQNQQPEFEPCQRKQWIVVR